MTTIPPNAPRGGRISARSGARSRRWLAPAAIALVLAGGLGLVLVLAPRREKPQPDNKPTPAMTVTATKALERSWPMTVTASGAIAPWQEASISAQIGGYRLVDVAVNVGDKVRAGQVLARLDPALLRAEEAQLLASAEQAEANRKRAQALKASGAISDQDVLQAVTEARTAAAALAAKRLQLRYTNVIAPDDGTISARTATLGAVATSGQELFRLIRKDRLEWRGEMTAAQISQIRPGQEIVLRLPDGSAAQARVRQIAPSLAEETRLALVYSDVRSGSQARAGMFAKGDVVLGTRPALVVPAESVVVRDGRSHVLALADDSATPRVALRSVGIGRRGQQEVEITSGLDADERVVVQGAGFLKDRDLVRIAPARANGDTGQ